MLNITVIARMSDEEFIEAVVMERMELCYSRWAARKSPERKSEYDKIEKAYEEAISSLSEKDKNAINKYIDSMFDDSSEETDFFYRAGIRDGYNLYRKIMEIQGAEAEK